VGLRKTISVVLASLFLFVVSIEIGTGAEYLVGPGDVISITVYDNDDLTTRVMVNDNGQIVMPLLGQIKVGNLSTPGISKEITDLLADGYIINPQVNVFIEEYRSKKVVILGRVRMPGLFELSGDISFLELISKAGGLAADAGDTATIKRTTGDGKNNNVILIDLLALIERGDITQNVQIMDGDTVNISKAGMCFVTGQVRAPGTYPCGDGSTVLKIIALSGGFNGKASKSSVRIVRIVNGEKKMMKDVALDTRLRQDDVIVVPESFF
jgi:polysaccharide export outer membrane protein